MRRACALARRGAGFVSPNPLVGAVIVKNGKILAEGHHRAYGKNHAEREAILKLAGQNPVKNCARGAALYVNLEPCAHYGRTPPCAGLIIEAGIKKVVFALRDPNPQVRRRDPVRLLRKAGVEVAYPCLESEARELNKIFLKNQTRNRPYITLKSAMTLDGRIADARGRSQWLTGEPARAAVHRLRLIYDAVLVGKNTVLKDNPRLNIRLPGIKKENYKIILGARADFPKNTNLLQDPRALFLGRNIKLKNALRALYQKHRICSVLVEGGQTVNTAFLKSGLVDEWQLFVAPKVLGDDALPVLGGLGIKNLDCAKNFRAHSVKKLGRDFLFVLFPE
ncbi:MAG: bifunctional diaminohydroxyphosphoribosylaminopyrimidine deaminase/5-amino-6-(5-phosphoribosylamino)uracil reductase RibD [Candidatus Margulisbacteria bacterium]|jgi:diaminohydroxyphosphoribosylaminopyrimidine deaminase/5-amino-6-(5-phosphoribosylamino)uracil reductase|nr:bifunctional diaminohydroxyphosphoribosylaminopyrimidine deaminase/5-amino-6-(5-phosphoribosylamino)uracil reductase RibD [Candidatus Margulisiibacteriota bacterium]